MFEDGSGNLNLISSFWRRPHCHRQAEIFLYRSREHHLRPILYTATREMSFFGLLYLGFCRYRLPCLVSHWRRSRTRRLFGSWDSNAASVPNLMRNMFGDWIYYPVAVVLLLANVASWAGTFYRLPGNWIVVANSVLVMCLLPQRQSGLGLGWFSICLLIVLAILGDSFNYASKRHQIFSPQASEPVRQRVLVGAGIGSLTCLLAGMAVPVIGSLLAVLGAVGGAAGGAWLGSVISPRQNLMHQEVSQEGLDQQRLAEQGPSLLKLAAQRAGLITPSPGPNILSDDQRKLIPRLLVGAIMVTIAGYASLF